jgi:hypothetical protein
MVGTRLIFSEDKMDDFILEMNKTYKEAGIPQVVLIQSKKYGEQVAKHIIAWADKDNYKQTRTFPKYSIDEDPTRWQPTPPAYMDAVEPSWNKIRPFIMERAGLSLTEPAGVFPSIFPRMILLRAAASAPGKRFNLTKGVLPTKSSMD